MLALRAIAFSSAVLLMRRSQALAAASNRKGVGGGRCQASWHGQIRDARAALVQDVAGLSPVEFVWCGGSCSMRSQSVNHSRAGVWGNCVPQRGRLLIGGRLRAFCHRFGVVCCAIASPQMAASGVPEAHGVPELTHETFTLP